MVDTMDKVVRLAGGASAEIDDNGNVTIIQDSDHSVTMTPERMYEIVVWLVERHLSYLDFKAHELPQEQRCFECSEPLVQQMSYVYQLDEGNVEVCMFCHFSIVQFVDELK
jgi:hypothetical protein